MPVRTTEASVGTGLSRLRERLSFLYGDDANLKCESRGDGSYEATLTVPRRKER
jgi:LytS/YehU family sensor histidine kinase